MVIGVISYKREAVVEIWDNQWCQHWNRNRRNVMALKLESLITSVDRSSVPIGA